jgi:hypothetical protein
MEKILYAVVSGFLFVIVIISGCIGPDTNCGDTFCKPPNICCKGTCYQQCPENTFMNTQCACDVKPAGESASPSESQVVSKPVSSVQGLMVWYNFEDDFIRSGRVTDKSGNARDAIVKGKVSTAQGITGTKGIRFSGSGYLLSSDNPAADRKDVTFSFWFRTDSPDANYKIASAALWNGGPGSGWTMATHVPEFWSDDRQGVLVPAQPNVANNFIPGSWNHEVVTYDGNFIREYTNGKLINSWQSRGVPMGKGVPMAIGCWPGFGFYFIGDLDDFQIYDYALTGGEIATMYKSGLKGTA